MKKIIYWFRRDLRLEDNHGLFKALNSGFEVIPIFIFDKEILGYFNDPNDPRVTFIHERLTHINERLKEYGSCLETYYDNVLDAYKEIISKHKNIEAVYTNKDYEPRTRLRDEKVKDLLFSHEIGFESFKDHVIFEEKEIVKADGKPYTVYTPYKRRWLENLKESNYEAFKSEKHLDKLFKMKNKKIISLKEMGYQESTIKIPKAEIKKGKLKDYDKKRDFPSVDGTSLQGIHLRFGTISIRKYVREAMKINDTWLSELIWRDFFSQILFNFPHVATKEFKEKYSAIPWRDKKECSKEFEAWKEGKTGYPMVDAGMRELNATGHMHNRVRMVTASFLIKHLLIDWRLGERYFAKKLLDYDLASNNGNWQWAAGCGCDAAPYFRVFNPTSQMDKFDKNREYIKKWIPEFETDDYPEPIVEHKFARERVLKLFKDHLK